jgi:hypothetical protein
VAERAPPALVAGFEHRERLLEADLRRAHMRQRHDDPIRHAPILGGAPRPVANPR